jgi:hypothetical protein
MIHDFLEHLLWAVRIGHFENTATRGTTNPELVEQLTKYIKKRQTNSLISATSMDHDVSPEDVKRWRDALARLRELQIRALEGLMPLFREALDGARQPKAFMVRQINADEIQQWIDQVEEHSRRLVSE